MSASFELRPARPSDAAGIAGVHLRAWRAAYEHLAPREAYETLTEAVRLARWTRMLETAREDEAYLVAEQDGRIVGVGAVGPPSQALFGARGEFKHLYLAPEIQGRGLGRRFMAALAGRIAAWGRPGGALGVVEGNAPAIGFYAQLGGREIGRYVDPGPIWRSNNIALAFDDLARLAAG